METEITVEDLLNLEGVDFKLEDENSNKGAEPAPKEDDKPKEETKEEQPKGQTPAFYSNVSKKLLANGRWQDFTIEVDGKEVKLSEADDIDEETFFQIYEAQEETREEELKDNYISVKEIDENKRKLINIIKNGGDLKEIFQSETNLKKPFEGLDLTDETTQKAIVFQQYRKQGLSESEARELTDKAAKELTLDTKAESIVKAYQDHYDKMLSEREKEVVEAKKAEEAAIKEYRKTLSSSYKEDGLSDTVIRRLVDTATKKDAEGELVIDGIYQKLMEDPQKAKELIFFMLEPENYLKAKGATIKTKEQLDMIKKVKILRDTGAKTTPKQEEAPATTDVFSTIVLD